MTEIAFIGLGNMGSGMCANLSKAAHQVRAFDLDPAAVAAAAEAGARPCATLAEVVAGAEITITMLPTGRHVLEVYFSDDGVAAHATAGALFIDCSTIAVEDARRAARQAAAKSFAFVDAPVSGGVAAAQMGTLTFMAGGDQEAYERAEVILAAMGKNVFHAGAVGNGQAAKIANNMLLAISMIGTCEAFNLAERLGLEAETFFNIASNASGQCWSMTSYCPAPGPVPSAPSNRDYEAGFTVAMMLKDLRLALDAAQSAAAATPLGEQAKLIYAAMDEQGLSALDFSSVMRLIKNEM